MLIIDGNHLASRCRHTLGDLRTSDGRPSGVVAGVLVGVKSAMNNAGYGWKDCLIVWDGGRAKWRMDLYPEYKLRKGTPDVEDNKNYYAQVDALVEGMRFIGVRQVKARGIEADDAISVFAHRLFNEGKRPTIYSGDKDFHQLTRIANLFTPNSVWVNEPLVLVEWGLQSVDQLLEVRAMIGDASDNIRGVPGIGPKRAVQVVVDKQVYALLTPKQKKWVDVAAAHEDIIARNKKLMKLPVCWTDTYYGDNEIIDAEEQYARPNQHDDERFGVFARDWDLNATLERIGR